MPSKRDVLNAFTSHKLRDLIDANDLHPAERRRKDALIDALADDSVDLEAILEGGSRDDLKALCRQFGLDDGGRVKAVPACHRRAHSGPGTGTDASHPASHPGPCVEETWREDREKVPKWRRKSSERRRCP